MKRGVAKGFLYRFVRHPQYRCLEIAGVGLLTIWPRLLLLGIWVSMLFLYAGLRVGVSTHTFRNGCEATWFTRPPDRRRRAWHPAGCPGATVLSP